jgi:hypothetical protein
MYFEGGRGRTIATHNWSIHLELAETIVYMYFNSEPSLISVSPRAFWIPSSPSRNKSGLYDKLAVETVDKLR